MDQDQYKTTNPLEDVTYTIDTDDDILKTFADVQPYFGGDVDDDLLTQDGDNNDRVYKMKDPYLTKGKGKKNYT